jgi:hypothetical protein
MGFGVKAPAYWDGLSSLDRMRSTLIARPQIGTDPQRTHEPPYFGWFSNILPIFSSTLNLKTQVPKAYIELEPTDHPLAVEQCEGITMHRVCEIAELLRHPA